MPSISLSRKFWMVPARLKVAMARRSWSASLGVKPAATMAIFMACSWNSGTPRVLPSTAAQRLGREAHPAPRPLRRRR